MNERIDELRRAWIEFCETPFPTYGHGDLAGELHVQLSLRDGEVAGTVMKFLKDPDVRRDQLQPDEELAVLIRLARSSPDPPVAASGAAYSEYFARLEQITILLNDCLADR